MKIGKHHKPVEILLVEDNPGDIRLTEEALREGRVSNNLHKVENGVEAMAFLHRRGKYADAAHPDLVLLDLNLPLKDGREVLEEIKSDEQLKRIPVIVLTTSSAEVDILHTYDNHGNAYITKPIDLDQFVKAIKAIEDFWFKIAMLPGTKNER